MGAEVSKQINKLTLLLLDNLSQKLKSGSLFEFENLIDDLLRGLLYDSLAASGTVWNRCVPKAVEGNRGFR